MPFFVYILASQGNGTLYIGYADEILRRVTAHMSLSLGGFTARYDVERLVRYEIHESRESAWTRERQMKKWRRAWKLELIERRPGGISSKISANKKSLDPRLRGEERRGSRPGHDRVIQFLDQCGLIAWKITIVWSCVSISPRPGTSFRVQRSPPITTV